MSSAIWSLELQLPIMLPVLFFFVIKKIIGKIDVEYIELAQWYDWGQNKNAL